MNGDGGICVGVIGLNGHAARIISILENISKVVKIIIYYPGIKASHDSRITKQFNDLKSCDAIVIASPTSSHVDYLKKLERYSGYILCEKPAFASYSDLKFIERWYEQKRARFGINYNFLYSPVAKKLENFVKDPEFGRAITLKIHSSHGLAFDSTYVRSWRSFSAKYGVAELVGVHFINFAMHLLGPLKRSGVSLTNFSGNGQTSDTAFIHLVTQNDCHVQICVSYAAPFAFSIDLIGTNMIYRYDGQTQLIRGPRNHRDDEGRFCNPPIIFKSEIKHQDNFRLGLENALLEFVDSVAQGGLLDPQNVRLALDTMTPLFDLDSSP